MQDVRPGSDRPDLAAAERSAAQAGTNGTPSGPPHAAAGEPRDRAIDDGRTEMVCHVRIDGTTTPRAGTDAGTPPRGLRVLVVEDHEDSAEMMARILSVDRHEVTAVTTMAAAVAALSACRPNGFDLIISDLGLPDGSGLDVVRAARQTLGMTIPAIAVTGYGMEQDVARAYEAGFDLHLTKSVNLRQVNDAVARVTRRR